MALQLEVEQIAAKSEGGEAVLGKGLGLNVRGLQLIARCSKFKSMLSFTSTCQ